MRVVRVTPSARVPARSVRIGARVVGTALRRLHLGPLKWKSHWVLTVQFGSVQLSSSLKGDLAVLNRLNATALCVRHAVPVRVLPAAGGPAVGASPFHTPAPAPVPGISPSLKKALYQYAHESAAITAARTPRLTRMST